MEVTETIKCPYCGQSFDLVIDTSTPTQRFTTDCEACCRPFEIFAECEPREGSCGIPLGIALTIGIAQDPNGWLVER
jgi:hypothetical protein